MSVEDHQGNLWDTIPPPGLGTPLGRLRSRRSKRCADPGCLWTVEIVYDPEAGSWSIVHDCDGDWSGPVRVHVSITGYPEWQDAARHAHELRLVTPDR